MEPKELNRINGSTRTRKGDAGYTELIQGYEYPKSDYICFIQNEIQEAITQVTLWYLKYNLLDTEDIELIKLLENPYLNNLSGNVWGKFEIKILVPTEEDYLKFESRRVSINKEFKSAKDFIVFSTIPSCELYLINLKFRKLEHYIWYIIHRFYGYSIKNYTKECELTGSFYNMLGDYFYNLCRYTQKKLHEKEDYWNI